MGWYHYHHENDYFSITTKLLSILHYGNLSMQTIKKITIEIKDTLYILSIWSYIAFISLSRFFFVLKLIRQHNVKQEPQCLNGTTWALTDTRVSVLKREL